MLSFIKKAFSKRKKPHIEFTHEVLGPMTYMHDGSYWEAANGDIFHSIPGDETGPNADSVKFIQNKIDSLDHYFEQCSEDLLSIAHTWDSIDKALTAKELFKVSAISVEAEGNREWEICFETKSDYKWVYIGLQFEGEEIVSNDIST